MYRNQLAPQTITDWARFYRHELGWKVRITDEDVVELDDPGITMLRTNAALGALIHQAIPATFTLICQPTLTESAYWLFPCLHRDDAEQPDHPCLSWTDTAWFVGRSWELPILTAGEDPRMSCCRWWPHPPDPWELPSRTELADIAEAAAGEYLAATGMA